MKGSRYNSKRPDLVKVLVRYLWKGQRDLLLQRQRLQFTMSMEKLMEAENKMTTDSHRVDSEESHARWRADAKENGI